MEMLKEMDFFFWILILMWKEGNNLQDLLLWKEHHNIQFWSIKLTKESW